MVPDKFNMVDMDGIDLIMMQGEEVSGLYMRLVESIAQCRYQCLYNWFFDGVVIPPTYVKMEVNEDDEVEINEGVTVSPDDVLHIYSLEPAPVDPEIIPLLAEENGVYNVPTGKDGFNPVTVDVPSYTPVINPLSVTENGTYTAPSGVDGYSPIIVNVSSSGPIEEWDFKESFNGEIIGIVIAPTNVTRDTSGAIFDGVNDYLTVPVRIQPLTIEIDVGSMNLSSGQNRRFVMVGAENGLIYRSTGKWSFYSGSWATDTNITAGNFFENSTLKIVVDSSSYWHIYKDDVLVYEPNRPLQLSDSNFKIGSSSSSINNAIIEGLRIFL